MTITQQLHARWLEHDLAKMNAGGIVIRPTFIEDVGSAAAENIRSAALMRWFNANPERGHEWLSSLAKKFQPGKAPYRVTREHYLDPKNRIDLVVWDADGVPIAFIEAKWSSPVRHADQLEVYRSLIDREHAGVPLLVLSPIRHTRPVGGSAISLTATTWQALTNFLQKDSRLKSEPLDADLWRTCLRLKTLEDVLIEGISENKTLSEFMELHTWLARATDSDNKSLGYSDFTRQILLTFLAEELAKRINLFEHGPTWRRSVTVKGARNDAQSDICPVTPSDGLIHGDDLRPNSISLVARFHTYPSFDEIKVGIGTQITPYREGAARRRWITENPLLMQNTADKLFAIRSTIIEKLTHCDIKNSKNAASRETAWFKEFAPKKFTGDSRVSELQEYGVLLAHVIKSTLQQYI